MRHVLITALCAAALFVVGSTPASAVGLPMMYEIKPSEDANEVLARLVEKSLRMSPDGSAPIEGSECTTPRHFATAIRTYHPGAELGDVQELPAYLRSLQLKEAPAGEFTMSRIQLKKLDKGESCKLELDGWTRSFGSAEGAWFDPNTGKPVLAADCSNVVKPVEGSSAVLQSPPSGGSLTDLEPVNSVCGGNGRRIMLFVWPIGELPDDLANRVRKLIRVQNSEESFRGERVSRTLGPEIKDALARTAQASFSVEVTHVVTADGDIELAQTSAPKTVRVTDGYATFVVPNGATEDEHAVRIRFPDQIAGHHVLAPTRGPFGDRSVMDYADEWSRGQCTQEVHAVVEQR